VIHAKLEKPDVEPVVTPKNPFDTAVLMAGIQTPDPIPTKLSRTWKKLAKTNPGKPGPLEYLAWIRLASANPQSAIAPFREALEAGTRDANLCLYYAARLHTFIPEAEYVARSASSGGNRSRILRCSAGASRPTLWTPGTIRRPSNGCTL